MINIKVNKEFKQLSPLVVGSLSFTFVKMYNNMLTDKDIILSDFKKQSGIYLLHNQVNGKQYVDCASDLKKRFYLYYSPVQLIDNRYVSNSIIKYGHNNFSVVLVEIITTDKDDLKKIILKREQHFIDLLRPQLNLSPTARSNLGYKHGKETKLMWSRLKTGTRLSEETSMGGAFDVSRGLRPLETKAILSKLFSRELNLFWGKTHNLDSLTKMRLSKIGELNPVFGKEKSPEFIEQIYKYKGGPNNPMFGKTHSPETLSKIRKPVWVYDSTSIEFIKICDGVVQLKKDMKMGYDTINKYLNSDKPFKSPAPWRGGIE